jgi:hypothetical protein
MSASQAVRAPALGPARPLQIETGEVFIMTRNALYVPIAPRLISSRLTFFYKRVLPVIVFGVFGLVAIVALSAQRSSPGPGVFIVLHMGFMATIGFLVMKKLVFDLVDEVWDEGSALLIKNKGQQVRVELSAIVNVGHSMFANPARVTLLVRHGTPLGDELAFLPPTQLIRSARNPLVEELIQRVDAARMKAARAGSM